MTEKKTCTLFQLCNVLVNNLSFLNTSFLQCSGGFTIFLTALSLFHSGRFFVQILFFISTENIGTFRENVARHPTPPFSRFALWLSGSGRFIRHFLETIIMQKPNPQSTALFCLDGQPNYVR